MNGLTGVGIYFKLAGFQILTTPFTLVFIIDFLQSVRYLRL
jgi:hypothetical protein